MKHENVRIFYNHNFTLVYFVMLHYLVLILSTYSHLLHQITATHRYRKSGKTKSDELNPLVRLFYCGEAPLMAQHSIKVMNDHASVVVNSNSVKNPGNVNVQVSLLLCNEKSHLAMSMN